MEMTTTKDRVLEAAETCLTARNVLKILYPEAFCQNEPTNGSVWIMGECLYLARAYDQGVYLYPINSEPENVNGRLKWADLPEKERKRFRLFTGTIHIDPALSDKVAWVERS